MKLKQAPSSALSPDLKEISIQDVQKRILSELMYHSVMTFNQLWHKQGESNKFAYHLKQLEQKGLVEKTEKGYQLTQKGKQYVPYLKSQTGKEWKGPLICIALVVIDEKRNQVLMFQRGKQPWLGYCGFHGGKIDSSEYILESAERCLKEETGLSAGTFSLKGIFSSKTYEQKKLSYNHQLFVIKATHFKGKLLKKTRKGTNVWVSIDNIAQQNIFPNSPLLLKIALSKRFKWIEADRFQENDIFTGIYIKKELSF
ncbi:NUDIX domain-containing protein [Candidatus Woesearchaeota archaeon]|nr:NUDIX domain-containing protein [Candidatus Woesearchaeota archaeon]